MITLLQVRILALLDREGPMSDIQMSRHLHVDRLMDVVTSTIDLGKNFFIKPSGDPFIVWELTAQGRDQLEIANARQGGVLCS
jgi:hypothetical protein